MKFNFITLAICMECNFILCKVSLPCSKKCYSKILDIILKYFYFVLFLLFDYLKCSVFGNCNVANAKRVLDQRHCHQSFNISQTLTAKLSQFSVVLIITIMRQPKQKPPVELPPHPMLVLCLVSLWEEPAE